MKVITSPQDRQSFMRQVLRDVDALESMLDRGMFETGVRRVGVEQEINFVDRAWRPAPVGPEILRRLDRNHLTTEYARFNLEINCEPLPFGPGCLERLRDTLRTELDRVDAAAAELDARLLMTGVVPTIRKTDVTVDALTPEPRYRALFKAVRDARGKGYEFHIEGLDELISRDNRLVLNGCYTSFQLHYQVDPDDAVDRLNWAQAIAGPLLAAATNSPIFFGKRLWRETRIALFQQTADFRQPYDNTKGERPRVSFGQGWVEGSILEVMREDIASHRAFLSTDDDEDPMELIERGEAPQLKALAFHNGTVYRWNRPCYGVCDGRPTLRIENRILPAGPTLADEIANAAFWWGLMAGMSDEHRTLPERMDFDHAKQNFLGAAQRGLGVQFEWDGRRKPVPADELIRKELLPIARAGLEGAGLDASEIDAALGVIEDRVRTGRTGSQWILDSYARLVGQGTVDEALVAIAAAMAERQDEDRPVHEWDLAEMAEAGSWQNRFARLGQIMRESVYVVRESDVIDLPAHMIHWRKIGHVPVENEDGEFVGLVNRDVLVSHLLTHGGNSESVAVKDVMLDDVVTVTPRTPTRRGVELMLEHDLSCLPVVEEKKVAGLVTRRDLIKVLKHVLEECSEDDGDRDAD